MLTDHNNYYALRYYNLCKYTTIRNSQKGIIVVKNDSKTTLISLEKMKMNKAVFLDRDGVINRSLIIEGKPIAPNHLKDFEIFDYVKDALSLLKQNDFLTIVITNQPDVGRNKIPQKNIDEIHEHLKSKVSLDEIYVCWFSNTNVNVFIIYDIRCNGYIYKHDGFVWSYYGIGYAG